MLEGKPILSKASGRVKTAKHYSCSEAWDGAQRSSRTNHCQRSAS
jgi:hypothetical protein